MKSFWDWLIRDKHITRKEFDTFTKERQEEFKRAWYKHISR